MIIFGYVMLQALYNGSFCFKSKRSEANFALLIGKFSISMQNEPEYYKKHLQKSEAKHFIR